MRWFKGLFAIAAIVLMATPAAAKDETVIEFSSGSGARSVGIIPANEEVEASGPAAITVSDEGTIYVLDQNNSRVIAVNAERSQSEPAILALPENADAEDLAAIHDGLYLWADGVVPLEKVGQEGRSQTLRAADGGAADEYANSVFASMGSTPPGPLNSITQDIGRSAGDNARPVVTQYVPSRGLGDIVAEVSTPSADSARILLRLRNSGVNFVSLDLQAEDRVGTVEVLDVDSTGRPYVLVELIPSDAPQDSGLLVTRFSPDGVLERVYELPLSPDSVFSRRFVAIGPRGDVLFLRSEQDSVKVLRLAGRTPRAKIAIDLPAPPMSEAKPGKVPKVAVVPKTRNDILERAFAFETITWRLTPSAYGKDPGPGCANLNRLRRPRYLVGKLGQEVQGVPYCWGCKTPIQDFVKGLERQKIAGNVCTKSAPQSNILGVDCSGFVSEAWGLKAHFATSAIPQISRRLSDPWSLQPGDALNKPGSHVMLFMRFTDDRKVEVMEASPNACKGRVCRNIYPLASLLRRGYQPVRFKGIGS